ncbi:MAG: cytochrome c-type biogenesis protein [Gemmatimonas sp.]
MKLTLIQDPQASTASQPQAPPSSTIRETPEIARDIIANAMSPFCPGLSLAACPSPSADSLRAVIVQRAQKGDSRDAILNDLSRDYGSAIRGSPEATGFGLVGWAMPGVAFLLGAFFLVRWMRSSNRRRQQQAGPQRGSGAPRPALALGTEADEARLRDILRRDD